MKENCPPHLLSPAYFEVVGKAARVRQKFKLQFKKKIPVPLVFSNLYKMKSKKCAQGLDLKNRGSKSMNYIAAGLSETATDD